MGERALRTKGTDTVVTAMYEVSTFWPGGWQGEALQQDGVTAKCEFQKHFFAV